MDAEEARTIGRRVRQVRYARRKSLRVIAGLAGMSTTMLHRIEAGQRALDSRSETVALANALEVAPTDLVSLPVPAPADGEADSAAEEVRLALMGVNHRHPDGEVLTLDALREQVGALADAGNEGDQELIGRELPALIRNTHTSVTDGRDVAELLDVVVALHTQVTIGWLRTAGVSIDLREQAALLARNAAEERGTLTVMGLAAGAAVRVMLSTGAFDLAQAELDSVTMPTNTPESTQLAGMLALFRSLVAASDGRQGDVEAPLEYATELAQRTGQGNAYWMGFGPTNVGLWRMAAALEVKDYDRAVAVAEGLNPREHPSHERQATYWMDYGRALARLNGRHEDAVRAFRTAERLFPMRVLRNPFVREVLAELLTRSRRDAVGRELRGMAYRAGLPV
ncbi:MAG: helix-turn-helix domain-containing protein [Pseudonocardiaceae bacterium]